MMKRWQMMREAADAFGQACSGKNLRALFGFDGYIDSLYAVVEHTDENGHPCCFQTSDGFLACLAGLNGQSGERELKLKSRRAGGNAPLTALAAGTLGIDAHCMGFIGADMPQFKELNTRCRTTSLGEPAECMALEFANCKWMFSDCESLKGFKAEDLLRADSEAFWGAVEESQLLALLNWAAMGQNADVVKLLLDRYQKDDLLGKKTFFVDFSDISGLAQQTVERYIKAVNLLAQCAHVVVSVNLHEAQSLTHSGGKDDEKEENMLDLIRNMTGAGEIVLHAMDHALCLEKGMLYHCQGVYHPSPAITTGGGDHFNGGYCAAILAGLPAEQRLALATATALFYVSHGYSGTLQQIVAWLDKRQAC